jgi:hypothetical protein
LRQRCLGQGPDDAIDLDTVLEHDHGRDALDAVAQSVLVVLIGVDLRHDDLVLVVVGDLFENRSNHATGSAPGSPEVHQHRELGLEYLIIKLRVGYRLGLVHCFDLRHSIVDSFGGYTD